jgi:WbqC-like protein family
MAKRIAIIQSCYIPWRGFFDLVSRCDEFVIFDSVQFRKRHWHNRNQIKTAQGLHWLTIPVLTKSRFEQPIDEVEVVPGWAEAHWATICNAYARAPCFAAEAPAIETFYGDAGRCVRLTDVNEVLLRGIAGHIGLDVKITRDTAYAPEGRQSHRLLDICQKAGATHYLSGPSAQSYLDQPMFVAAGITVEWMGYAGYPAYPQIWGDFAPALSILDMIFNTGPDDQSLWRGIGR